MFLISIHLSRYFVRDGKGDSTKQIPVTITTSTLSPPVNYQKPVAQWQTHIYVQRKIWISRWVRLNLSVIERPGENIRSISHLQANVDGSQWILQIQYIQLFFWYSQTAFKEKKKHTCVWCVGQLGKKETAEKIKRSCSRALHWPDYSVHVLPACPVWLNIFLKSMPKALESVKLKKRQNQHNILYRDIKKYQKGNFAKDLD